MDPIKSISPLRSSTIVVDANSTGTFGSSFFKRTSMQARGFCVQSISSTATVNNGARPIDTLFIGVNQQTPVQMKVRDSFNLPTSVQSLDTIEIYNTATFSIIVTVTFFEYGQYIPGRQYDSFRLVNTCNFNSPLIRPNNTTAYAAGQVVNHAAGDSLTFIVFPDGSLTGSIVGAKMLKNSVTTANANFRLYLFYGSGGLPTLGADQSAFSMTFAQASAALNAGFIGVIDFPTFATDSANFAFCTLSGIEVPLMSPGSGTQASNGVVTGLLVAQAAYVPIALEQFEVQLTVQLN